MINSADQTRTHLPYMVMTNIYCCSQDAFDGVQGEGKLKFGDGDMTLRQGDQYSVSLLTGRQMLPY